MISEVIHVVRSAIMEKYVPGAIVADCRKENQNDFSCVDERGHHCTSMNVQDVDVQLLEPDQTPTKSM